MPVDCAAKSNGQFINGDFETPILPSGNLWFQYTSSWVQGWKTTDTAIEIWKTGMLGYTASKGNQWAEINARLAGALYQYIDTIPGDNMEFSFSHRGRVGADTLEVFAGPESPGLVTETLSVSLGQFKTNSSAWVRYTSLYTVPPGQNKTGFRFQAIANGSPLNCGAPNSCGNLIDNIVVRPRRCAP